MRLAFKKGITPWDWAIRIFSSGPYSHCEIVFSDGTFFSALPFSKVIYHKVSNTDRWVFVDLDISPEDEFIIRNWCDLQAGRKYDWLGIARFIFGCIEPSEERWFCSEICIKALQLVGLFQNVEAHKIHPVGLYELCGQM